MQRIKVCGRLCLLASLILFVSVFFFCGFTTEKNTTTAYAEATSVEIEDGTEAPSPAGENGLEAEGGSTDDTADKAPATFLSRVGEWFENNLAEFFSGATLVTAFSTVAAVIVSWRKNKKLKAATDALLAGVQAKTDNNTEINGKVIDAINALIEKYNKVQEYIAQLDKKELTRDAICNEMATFGKTILEILATVYANNQNIPQGVKDLVTLKYASALKAENEVVALQAQTEESDGEEG